MSKNESLGQGGRRSYQVLQSRSCGTEFDSFGDMQKTHNDSAYPERSYSIISQRTTILDRLPYEHRPIVKKSFGPVYT
ncbi:MAG: hypothetical protein M3232_00710 [Thermoproteota archaeon]|nr:hypothetical protein [Thermoproteota archaeon]